MKIINATNILMCISYSKFIQIEEHNECPLPGVVSFSCPEVLGENGSSKILKLINLVPY